MFNRFQTLGAISLKFRSSFSTFPVQSIPVKEPLYLLNASVKWHPNCFINILCGFIVDELPFPLTFADHCDSYRHAHELGLGVYRGVHAYLLLGTLKVKR